MSIERQNTFREVGLVAGIIAGGSIVVIATGGIGALFAGSIVASAAWPLPILGGIVGGGAAGATAGHMLGKDDDKL